MKKCRFKFRKLNNGWFFQIGGVNGEAFRLLLRYFNKRGYRLEVDLNTETLIKLFGFNQKIIGV